jgi:putative transposase
VLEISPSGFYAWRSRPPSARSLEDARIAGRIRAIQEVSRGTYGAPRIHAELADEGVRVGRKRVARLMRAEGLRGVSRRRFETTTVRDASARAAPDLVRRDFPAKAPDQLRVADITHVPTWSGFLYLAVVLDA